MNDLIIQMTGVSKLFGNGVRALDNVNIEIKRGEFVFLVGPSGAGKTTVMSLLIYQQVPTEGEIIIDGLKFDMMTSQRIPYLRRNIGMVFQDFKLLEDRSVYENCAFALRVIGISESMIRNQVLKSLEIVGLSHKKNMSPLELSGGEKQRIAIARAICNDPGLLITDEPTGNLDPMMAMDIIKILNEINLRGTTVLVATHNRDIVNHFRKRVIGLVNGRITRDEQVGRYGF